MSYQKTIDVEARQFEPLDVSPSHNSNSKSITKLVVGCVVAGALILTATNTVGSNIEPMMVQTIATPVVSVPSAIRSQRAARRSTTVTAAMNQPVKPNGIAKKVASLAGAALIAVSSPAIADPIDILDKRKENVEGLQLIYEARDLDLNERTDQEGPSRFAFQKLTPEETFARAQEANKRLNGDVQEYIEKEYWTQASNELRRAVGSLRFDVDNLVKLKGKEFAPKQVDLFVTIEKLDFAIRQKDQTDALYFGAEAANKCNDLLKALS